MIPIVTGTIGLLAACVILLLMRQDRLHTHHGLGWIVVAIGFALLGFSPGIFDNLASYFGVSYPPVLALSLGIVVLVLKILLMDIERSHIEMRNQRLIQRIAMLEADLRKGLKAIDQATEPETDVTSQNEDS
jgi:hypothetical protein